jgi:hypothetical protein
MAGLSHLSEAPMTITYRSADPLSNLKFHISLKRVGNIHEGYQMHDFYRGARKDYLDACRRRKHAREADDVESHVAAEESLIKERERQANLRRSGAMSPVSAGPNSKHSDENSHINGNVGQPELERVVDGEEMPPLPPKTKGGQAGPQAGDANATSSSQEEARLLKERVEEVSVTIGWQEKVFGRREVKYYLNLEHPSDFREAKYQQRIRTLTEASRQFKGEGIDELGEEGGKENVVNASGNNNSGNNKNNENNNPVEDSVEEKNTAPFEGEIIFTHVDEDNHGDDSEKERVVVDSASKETTWTSLAKIHADIISRKRENTHGSSDRFQTFFVRASLPQQLQLLKKVRGTGEGGVIASHRETTPPPDTTPPPTSFWQLVKGTLAKALPSLPAAHDLNPPDANPQWEVTLLSCVADDSGNLSLRPGFTHPASPHCLVTPDGDVYRLEIVNAALQAACTEAANNAEWSTAWQEAVDEGDWQKLMAIEGESVMSVQGRSLQVITPPPVALAAPPPLRRPGSVHLSLRLLLQQVTALPGGTMPLRCRWQWMAPGADWVLKEGLSEGSTQTAVPRRVPAADSDPLRSKPQHLQAAWNQPLDVEWEGTIVGLHAKEAGSSAVRAPVLLLQVLSQRGCGVEECLGYASLEGLYAPGHQKHRLLLWKPSNTIRSSYNQLLIGASAELADVSYLASPTTPPHHLSRLGFRTECCGAIELTTDILIQQWDPAAAAATAAHHHQHGTGHPAGSATNRSRRGSTEGSIDRSSSLTKRLGSLQLKTATAATAGLLSTPRSSTQSLGRNAQAELPPLPPVSVAQLAPLPPL